MNEQWNVLKLKKKDFWGKTFEYELKYLTEISLIKEHQIYIYDKDKTYNI